MILILAQALIFSIILTGSAQPLEQWNKTFAGLGHDNVYSVKQTSDGGYILAGNTASYGGGAWLIRIDANGNQQWNKTLGDTASGYANSVQQTSDGGYILAGSTASYGAGDDDAWLIKVSSLNLSNISGYVYEGDIGNETLPLQGVTVSVYGSNNSYPVAGAILLPAPPLMVQPQQEVRSEPITGLSTAVRSKGKH